MWRRFVTVTFGRIRMQAHACGALRWWWWTFLTPHTRMRLSARMTNTPGPVKFDRGVGVNVYFCKLVALFAYIYTQARLLWHMLGYHTILQQLDAHMKVT